MILLKDNPANWADLQNVVGTIWQECGFKVSIEAKKSTVRGTVEIDVYAEETIQGRMHSFACECKYWKSAVPQTVVHAFRTVTADLGINQGYIVSTAGFQSGAYEAAKNSNIKLLSWSEWQEEFCQTWIKNYFIPSITQNLDDLMELTEPLVPNWFCNVEDSDVSILRQLRQKHTGLGALAMSFSHYSTMMGRRSISPLPLREMMMKLSTEYTLPDDSILDAIGYRDLYGLLIVHGRKAIAEFMEVKERNKAKPTGSGR